MGSSASAAYERVVASDRSTTPRHTCLSRDLQSEILGRTLSPTQWGRPAAFTFGGSKLVATRPGEVMVDGTAFGDLACCTPAARDDRA